MCKDQSQIMTSDEHKRRHIKLHAAMDELFADYVEQNRNESDFLELSILKLIDWSYRQTQNPDHEPFKKTKWYSWNELMELRPAKDGDYHLVLYNNMLAGDVLKTEDGYYKFFPVSGNGYWDGSIMRAIADLLDEMNEPWDKIVQKDIGER
jgi:hypothetical protein